MAEKSDVASPAGNEAVLGSQGPSGSAHTPGPITVSAFKTNTSRGFTLLATSEGVPDCPIGTAALKADADLWAAAPDLYAALTEVVAATDAYDESEAADDRCICAIEKCRAALSKATA